MRTSPLVSRAAIASVLFVSSFVSAQYLPGASFYNGNRAPGAASYQLVDDYEGTSNFFDKFSFYSGYDPTNGHVQYVNQTVAQQNGLVSTSAQTGAYIGVDTTNLYPNGGPGRPAVRLVSKNAYTHGLFILDLSHMPYGCGTWPAYWLLGPNWPSNGEIDIIEGVNTIAYNSMSLHTSEDCTISGAQQSGEFQTSNCYEAVNGNSGCGSSANNTVTPNNYGGTLNSNGGGVYAMEWTSNYIKTWFFGRNNIPVSITSGAPDVSQFGIPVFNAQGQCPIDQHFNNMSIVINTDFCGDWAGNVFIYYPGCPSESGQNSWGSCVDYVGNNPSAFTQAYWSINSVKVYQMPQGVKPSSSYSTSLSSVSAASTNTIPKGMGATTSGLSSSAYTGSLSSSSSTKIAATATSTATPFICPNTNATQWTDYNSQVYTIQCGSDYNGANGNLPASRLLASFEACLEYCDTLYGCLGASFSGGNEGGYCYPKATTGVFVYNGQTNAAIRAAGPVSLVSSSSSSSSSSSLAMSSSVAIISSSTGPTSRSSTRPSSTSSFSVTSTISTSSAATSSIIATSSGSSSSSASSTVTISSSNGGSAMSSTSYPSSSATSASPADVSSSSSTSSASASPSPACPSIDGTTLTDANGKQYLIGCASDTTPGAFDTEIYSKTDFTLCMTACDAKNGCAGWTWAPYSYPGGACYLKAAGAALVPGSADAIAGVMVVPQTSSTSSSTSSLLRSSSSADETSTISTAVSSASPSNEPSTPATATSSSAIAMSSSIPLCPTATCGTPSAARPSSSATPCQDSYGNTFSIHCGTQYVGTIQRQVSATDVNGCLLSCDTTQGCVAVSYLNGICSLLSEVTNTSVVEDAGAAAATRPADVSTVYATPPATSAMMSATSGVTTSAAAVPTPLCNSTYSDPESEVMYSVRCSTDNSGPSYATNSISSGGFGACFSTCNTDSRCVGFTFIGDGDSGNSGSCDLKSSLGVFTQAASTHVSCFKMQATMAKPTYTSPVVSTYTETGIYGTSIEQVTYRPSLTFTGGPATSSQYTAQPCPTSLTSLCSASKKTCSSSGGNNYDVTCGIEYEGTVIDTSNIGTSKVKVKRAIEPTFNDCQSLCDLTSGCVALNYEGTNCTLLSSVTGSSNVPGAVGASISAGSSAGPTCPGSANKLFTDSNGVAYSIGCYTGYAGNDVGSPITTTSLSACLSHCDALSGCYGVEFDFTGNRCVLKSSFAGTQTSDTSIIYGVKNRAASGGTSVNHTVTPTTTLSLSSGATITIVPTTTLTSLVPPGGSVTSGLSGSYYVHTSAPTGSASATAGNATCGGASVCYTCGLIPIVVAGPDCGGGKPSGGIGGGTVTGGGIGGASITGGICTLRPGHGTTVLTTTHTITRCTPGVCPASGYVIGGSPTQSDATIVTTTDKNGHPVTYTQIPTGSGGGDNSGGNGGNSGSTPTGLPSCPKSNNAGFTSPMGMIYQVFCDTYFTDDTLDTQTQDSLASCIASCDMYNIMSFMISSPCLGVSWYSNRKNENCELKAGSSSVYQRGIDSARLKTPYTGPSGGNGTGSGGNGGGGSGITMSGTMTAPPVVTTFVTGGTTYVTGGSTITTGGTTIVTGGSTIVVGGSTIFTAGSTVVQGGTTTVVGGSTIVEGGTAYVTGGSTYVSGGSTIVETVTGGGGGNGGNGGNGGGGSGGNGGNGGGGTGSGSGGGTGSGTGAGTSAGTGPGTGAGTGPGTGPGTGYGTDLSLVPYTEYITREATSTYVSNGVTYVTRYATRLVSVVYYAPASTTTVTTTTVSVSISNQISTVTGPTVTGTPHEITITAGPGQYITITGDPVTVTSYVYPSSSSSSFTCRTYATNYLNGYHGRAKRANKRSVFDVDQPLLMGEMARPKPGAVPQP